MEIMSAAGWRIKSGESHNISHSCSVLKEKILRLSQLTASNFRLRGGGRCDKMTFLLERAEVAL
jgi:hypothetical protein